MTYIRKNYMNILLFILWIGMSASLTTANADVQGGAVLSDPIADRLESLAPSAVLSRLPVED